MHIVKFIINLLIHLFIRIEYTFVEFILIDSYSVLLASLTYIIEFIIELF